MDPVLTNAITQCLASFFNSNVIISSSHATGGGCINETAVINTNNGKFFVKWNHAGKYPQMFEKEEKGLKILKATGEIGIPETIACGQSNETAFIILEYIASAPKQHNFWEAFGQALANLHKHTNNNFGLDHDNYIGCLPQYNGFCDSWTVFFITQRLEKQVKMAFDARKITHKHLKKFQKFYHEIPSIFPNSRPALLHGDLWGGNFMVNQAGYACIIDPAVYYGNREAEIAFTKLFGGFDPKFYSAYNNTLPLEKGFENRTNILNLYPLMVHVNLFGGGYLGQVDEVLSPF